MLADHVSDNCNMNHMLSLKLPDSCQWYMCATTPPVVKLRDLGLRQCAPPASAAFLPRNLPHQLTLPLLCLLGIVISFHADTAAPSFDMETAFKVLRSAGYAAHALSVAERAGEPDWVLDVLLEDMHSYPEGIAFIGGGVAYLLADNADCL